MEAPPRVQGGSKRKQSAAWSVARLPGKESLRQLEDILVRTRATQHMRPSTVYDGSVVRSSERRKSRQGTVKDEQLFDIARALLPSLGHGLERQLHLLRTHSDYIVSAPGDHFAAHRDFELVAGEGLCALAFIICLEAPSEGGELVLLPGHAASATIRYEDGLLVLFPCCTEHAAQPVVRGYKRLLKFDVVSQEPLQWLELPASPASACAPRAGIAIAPSLLQAVDVFRARQAFEGPTRGACLCTDLVDASELQLLMSFFAGRTLDDEQVPSLYTLLDKLCCPEGELALEDVRRLNSGKCVALPAEAEKISMFLGRPAAHLLFAACAHRTERNWPERLLVVSLTDMSGHAVTARSLDDRGKRWAPKSAIQEVYQAVLDEIAYFSEGAEALWNDSEHTCDACPAKKNMPQLGCGEDMRDAAPSLRSLDIDPKPMLRASIEELQTMQPHASYKARFREVEECNDGDTYLTVRYETTLVRRAYLLCPHSLYTPLHAESASPR